MVGSIIYRVFHMGLQFAAGVVISNLLLPQAFGSFSIMILNAALLSIVTGLGSEALVMHKLSNHDWSAREARKFLLNSFLIQIGLFLLLQLASISFAGKTVLAGGEMKFWWYELLYFAGLGLVDKSLAVLYPFHQDKPFNRTLALISFIFLLAVAICSFANIHGYPILLGLFALQSLAQGVTGAYMAGKIRSEAVESTELHYWVHLRQSSIAMLTNIVQLMAYRIDFWIIRLYHGDGAVGLFAQANKFANLAWILPSMLSQMLIPRFRYLPKAFLQLLFGLFLGLGFLLSVGALVFGYSMFHFFLVPDYLAGWGAQLRMMPGYLFWTFVIISGAYVAYRGRFKLNLLASSACLVMVLAADLLLVPRLGINGAAWADSIAYSITALIYLVLLRRAFEIRPKAGKALHFRENLGVLKYLRRSQSEEQDT